MNGLGKFIWKNGIMFEGQYLNDVRNGPGTIMWPTENNRKWVGVFLNGRQHGQGTIIKDETVEKDGKDII